MVETLFGGLLGGIFRLVPEVLKFFDAKNERQHELSMQDKAIEFQKLKGDQVIDEIAAQGQVSWNEAALDTLKTSIETQFRPSGIKWVDALSTLIRPLITVQWVIGLYPAVITAGFILAIQGGMPPLEALVRAFGPDEKALVGAILNFWFVGRVFDRVKT
jgi:hypothetical protein